MTSGLDEKNVAGARGLRAAAAGIAVASPVVSHIALAMGQGYGVAVALAAVQGGATGLLVWGWVPRYRWVGGAVCLVLWASLGLGLRGGAAAALLAEAGAAHGLLYAGLFGMFGWSMRPGSAAMVTRVARRVNARFQDEQVPYTRLVTWGWVLVFAAELAGSVGLLVGAPRRWAEFVTTWHPVLPVGFLVLEVGFRRWRWRHLHASGLIATVRGARRFMR